MFEDQKRVVIEKAKLDDEIIKLTQFIYSEKFRPVSEEEKAQMLKQLEAMQEYSRMLLNC